MYLTTKQETWQKYFSEVGENNKSVNEHIKSFTDISKPSNDRNSKINQLSRDNGESILLFYCKVSKSIKVVHSISDVGSSTWSPDPTIVALDGFKRNNSTQILFDTNSILKEVEVDLPLSTRILSLNSKDEIRESEAPANNPSKFKSLPFILLPPCLWNTVIEEEDKSPESIFVKVAESANKFIEDNKDDEILKTITKNDFLFILSFLWTAAKDKMEGLSFITAGDNENIQQWSIRRHLACIKPEKQQTTREEELIRISEAIESSRSSIQSSLSSSKEAEKKGFEKLDDSVKNMILNASAPNEEIAPGSPSEACKNFFKQSSHGNARLNFVRTMKHEFKAQVEVSPGVITSIFNGGFNWAYDDSPSNFSIFSFPEKKTFTKNVASDCIILQLKEISGKGLSSEDVKEALKQGIALPETVDSMKYSIYNFIAASKFFFSESSLLTKALVSVYNHVVNNRTIYNSIHHQNKMFIAEFMYAIDTRVNLWLESCEESKFREDVDDSLLSFDNILQLVRTRNFSYILPPSIRAVVEAEEEAESKSSKKRKTGNDTTSDKSQRTNNEGTIDAWIKPLDIYNNKVRNNKEHLEKRPTFNEEKICHRWHSRGYCFSNCNNSKTHVKSSSLPAQTKKEYKNWLDETTA